MAQQDHSWPHNIFHLFIFKRTLCIIIELKGRNENKRRRKGESMARKKHMTKSTRNNTMPLRHWPQAEANTEAGMAQ